MNIEYWKYLVFPKFLSDPILNLSKNVANSKIHKDLLNNLFTIHI